MGPPPTTEDRSGFWTPLMVGGVLLLVWWIRTGEKETPSQPNINPAVMSPASRGAPGYPAYRGYDLDCSDLSGPVIVAPGWDPHGLDADHDGVGCE